MQIWEQARLSGVSEHSVGKAQAAARRLAGGAAGKGKELYKACQDFEAILIKQMLDVMRKTVDKSGLLDGGFAQEVFEDMLYDEYAGKMARTAHFGLARLIYDQLSTEKTPQD